MFLYVFPFLLSVCLTLGFSDSYEDLSVSSGNLDPLSYQELFSEDETGQIDPTSSVSGGDLSISSSDDSIGDTDLQSDFFSDADIMPLNLNVGSTQLDLFDRIVSGTQYKYYYLYSVYGSPQVYNLYLSNDLDGSTLRNGILLSYTYTTGTSSHNTIYYLNRSSFSSFNCPLGNDLCYTNVLPDYPILGGLTYEEVQPFFVDSVLSGVFFGVILFLIAVFIMKLFCKGR